LKVMLRLRTALALLLLFSAAASAQEDLETALSAIVRISGTKDGSTVRGSGFVVGLAPGKATIVTASHVIEGLQQLEVTFAADPTERFPVDAFLGSETGNPHGLAVFQVRGSLPADVTLLSFETESQPKRGAELFLLGFPQMEVSPRTPRRALSGRRGTLLLIDQGIGEGFSGGPVLQGGKVVGIVTDTDEQTTYAVNAVVAREALEGWGGKLGGQSSTKTCVSGETLPEYGIDFVRICPGTFMMGSAENDPRAFDDQKPAHQVTLTSELWLGKTEITNAQFRRFQPNHLGEDGLPATNVTWTQAKAACESFGGRLPTEAEWEYAARADSQTAWSFGSDETKLDDYAWYDKNADGKPHPVATRKPNGWGFHDMYGNVWEWVADWSAPYEKGPQTDPTGPQAGDARVVRGGSFASSAEYLRSAVRGKVGPEGWADGFGFRCARGPRRQP
jgi:formylglycine-generating enzyme required for sulfatase activity